MFDKKRLVLALQQGDAEKRDAVYAGVGFVIGDHIKNNKSFKQNGDVKMLAKRYAYQLAEVAIVEKERLFNLVQGMSLLKFDQVNSGLTRYRNVSSLGEAMGPKNYFTDETLVNIDSNIDLFNTGVAECKLWLDSLDED